MNRIKELRNARKIKQAELAAAVSVSQAALSGYETGKYEADLETYMALADYFGVTLDYLLGRREDPEPAVSQEAAREVLAGPGLRLLLDADAGLSDGQLREIVDFIEFKRRQGEH